MPYFKCGRCALRLYSAAPGTRCSHCGSPLGEDERLTNSTRLERPRGGGRSLSWASPQPQRRAG